MDSNKFIFLIDFFLVALRKQLWLPSAEWGVYEWVVLHEVKVPGAVLVLMVENLGV